MKSLEAVVIAATAVVGMVLFGCGGGGGGSSSGPATALIAPVVEATYEDGKITVTWTDVPGAKSYNVYWATDDVPKEEATKVEVSQSPYLHAPALEATCYFFMVTAVDPSGGEGADSEKVKITVPGPNEFPIASFLSPVSLLLGQVATIDASASSDADGSISSYSFNFGDGTPWVNQSSPVVEHMYSDRGTFIISVVVTDDKGASSTATKEITIGLVAQDPVNVSRTETSYSQSPVAAVDSTGKNRCFLVRRRRPLLRDIHRWRKPVQHAKNLGPPRPLWVRPAGDHGGGE